VLPALAVLVVGDGMQCALSGVVRGAGAQAVAARFNLCAYYVVGLPFGIALAFGAHVGLVGLWVGLAVATNLQTVLLAVFLRRLDWRKTAAAVHAAQLAEAKAGAAAAAQGGMQLAAVGPRAEERRSLLDPGA
jgi:MATE family multidrug resistance protein